MTPHFHRDPIEHTAWCARDHTCGVDVHRSLPLIADGVGARAVLTRVQAGPSRYAEVTMRIPLHHTETGARWQVSTVLELLRVLLAKVAIRRGVLHARQARREISR